MITFSPIKRFFKLITTSSIDHEQHYKRLKLMERDIGVPVKIAVLVLMAIFLLNWKKVWPDYIETEATFHDPVQKLFYAYALVNVGAVVFFLFFNRWPLRVVHWVTVLMGLLDALVVSSLVVITGGLDSVVYWVFLVLIVRNAISIPIAITQVSVNLVTVACYLTSMFLWLEYIQPMQKPVWKMTTEEFQRFVPRDQFADYTTPAGNGTEPNDSEPPFVPESTGGNSSEAISPGRNLMRQVPDDALIEEENQMAYSLFFIRVFFLVLWTSLCYGVQVLFDRDREAQREAREFALRKEQLRSTGRLAAEIAHRLKNPLAIINNSAYTLDREMKGVDEQGCKQLAMIRDEVARSDLILTELMGYAKLSEGMVERLDFEEELKVAVNEAFPPSAQFKIQPKMRVEADLPPLMMQRPHLREVLVNLLVNAREASEEGGEVHIGARTTQDFSIELVVKDFGTGIPDDKMERIFELYFTTKDRGDGIGLAVVKQNVELYGGKIEVQSELGKGAEFVITLPTRALQEA